MVVVGARSRVMESQNTVGTPFPFWALSPGARQIQFVIFMLYSYWMHDIRYFMKTEGKYRFEIFEKFFGKYFGMQSHLF